MIRLAVLDMAGTTIDEGGAVYAALAGAVAKAGADPADEAVQRWMGTDKREAIRGLVAESTGEASDAIDDELVEKLYGDFRARLAGAYRADPPQPIAGVPETLALLRAQGVKVALTTGFARDVAEPLLEGLSWTIAGRGEDGAVVVDAVTCVDDVAAGRPAPYMIFRAMEATGVQSVAEVAVAGDTAVDLRAGTNAGARIVAGVATGKLTHDDLVVEPHTHLLHSVADLPAVIEASTRR